MDKLLVSVLGNRNSGKKRVAGSSVDNERENNRTSYLLLWYR